MPVDIGSVLIPPFNPAASTPTVSGYRWNPQTRRWEKSNEPEARAVQTPLEPPPALPTVPAEEQVNALPQAASAQPQLPGLPNENLWQKLQRNIQDPRVQMFLYAMGSSLAQPRRWGQTGIGHASEAIGQGYGALARATELQRQRDLAARKEQREQEAHAADVASKRASTASTLATTQKTGVETELLVPKFNLDVAVQQAKLSIDQGQLDNARQQTRQSWVAATRDYELKLQEYTEKGILDQRKAELDELKTKAEVAKILAEAAQIRQEIQQGGGQDKLRQLADLKVRAYQAVKATTLGKPEEVEAQARKYSEEIYALGGGQAQPGAPPAGQASIKESQISTFARRMGWSEPKAREWLKVNNVQVVP